MLKFTNMNNQKITLSYVTTTYNKLPYLKEVLGRLIAERQPDEEIIVVDGGSKDGTPEYLQQLHSEGKIQQWKTEPDKGESHGTNKGMLMAQGELIKIITDDDAFYYPAIRECKEFMLKNNQYDLLASDGVSVSWTRPDHFRPSSYFLPYEKYRQEGKPFDFCGLGLMIRRSSLPLIGLFHTSFTRIDAEYSLRITAGKGLLAWYSGPVWARILNPQSNSLVMKKRQEIEVKKLNHFYSDLKPGQKVEIDPHTWFDVLKGWLWRKKKQIVRKIRPFNMPATAPQGIQEAFARCDGWLKKANEEQPGKFL